jgi:uncharacterized protein YciI
MEHSLYAFVTELIYKAEQTEIDAHTKTHVTSLNKHDTAGTFLVSGRTPPA